MEEKLKSALDSKFDRWEVVDVFLPIGFDTALTVRHKALVIEVAGFRLNFVEVEAITGLDHNVDPWLRR